MLSLLQSYYGPARIGKMCLNDHPLTFLCLGANMYTSALSTEDICRRSGRTRPGYGE